MDPEFYMQWADAIQAGHGADYLPFPRGPLYPYILAGVRALTGAGWFGPRLLNLLCDLASIVLIYWIGLRLGKVAAALIAAGLYAFCGAAVYFSGEILATSLEAVLGLLFMFSLIHGLTDSNRFRWMALSGASLGLLALSRPNALILTPLLLLTLWKSESNRTPWRPRLLLLALTGIGALLLVIAPVFWFNYQSSHAIIPVATQGGVNFYIGNAQGANGWASELPSTGNAWEDSDAKRIAEQEAGRTLDPGDVSKVLWKLGWEEIIADPIGWMGLFLRKCLLLINLQEIGNNRPLSLARAAAPQLNFLFLLSLGALIPFALIGCLGNLRKTPILVMALFIVGYGFSMLLFFVNTRYRMPLVPPLMLMASLGCVELFEAFRLKKHSLINYALLAGGIMLAYPNWLGSSFERPAQSCFVKGNALLRMGRPAEALLCYTQTAQTEPNYPDLHLNRGVALMQLGDTSEAVGEFRSETERYPGNAKAWNNLGVGYDAGEYLTQAKDAYRQALALASDFADARLNLTRVLLKDGDAQFQRGNLANAAEVFEEASTLTSNDPKPPYRRALVAIATGDWATARIWVEKALDADPAYEAARTLMSRPEFKE